MRDGSPVAPKAALSRTSRSTLEKEWCIVRNIGEHPGIVYPIGWLLDDRKANSAIQVMVLPYYADGHVSSTMCWCLAERLVQDISGALENCHAAGYLHLDVSRGNILVDGTCFGLSDFGLARQETKRNFDENDESGTPYGRSESILVSSIQ